jgi:hypothetical protein
VELLRQNGPQRVAELKAAAGPAEAHAAAQALKASASHLGLSAVEDLCDQALEASAGWADLAASLDAALKRGLAALSAARLKL